MGRRKSMPLPAFFLVLLLQCSNFIYGQSGINSTTVSGVVSNEEGMPIEGASIIVKGSIGGVISDKSGAFTITVNNLKQVLLVSAVNHNPEEVPLAGKDHITIALQRNYGQLQDVVMVGYGVKDKRSLSSAVSTLQNKTMKDWMMAVFRITRRRWVIGCLFITPRVGPMQVPLFRGECMKTMVTPLCWLAITQP